MIANSNLRNENNMSLLAPILQRDHDTARIANVTARMIRACHDYGRLESDVELVCVSKGFGADAILPVLEAGQRIFGENRVQEAAQKWPKLRGKPRLKVASYRAATIK